MDKKSEKKYEGASCSAPGKKEEQQCSQGSKGSCGKSESSDKKSEKK